MTTLRLSNRDARRLWLAQNLVTDAPNTPRAIIQALGFLQIDTVRNVARAHDHILWTRLPGYREEGVWPLLAGRDLYEHFTHDASLIPVETLPYWTRRFHDLGAQTARSDWHHSGLDKAEIQRIRDRIEAEGPLSTHAFDSKARSGEIWSRPPHKRALDQMWYAGKLATAHREKFIKFYDLGARVFPGGIDHGHSPEAQADWLHGAAMTRLGFATPGELYRFWEATSAAEARGWATNADLIPVDIETADGSTYGALATPDIQARLAAAPTPGKRMRLINPFDPAIRDRARLARLFGFTYRNEMFTPKAKRQYGYYTYPLLDGDRFVARIELKADRREGLLTVVGYWAEPGLQSSTGRSRRLDAELDRFRRFAGLARVDWACPRP